MNSQENPKLKILIVDDEPDNLDLLYRTFHRDYKVLRAESGPRCPRNFGKTGRSCGDYLRPANAKNERYGVSQSDGG